MNWKKKSVRSWTVFDVTAKEKELKALELKTQSADFWKDNVAAAKISQQISELKEEMETMELLKKELADLKELDDLSKNNESVAEELHKKYNELKEKLEKVEFKIFLSGKYDKNNAIVEIFSGAGGQDSQDWATMLLRMYERYFAKKGFKVQVLHQTFGDAGGPEGRIGTKSVTLEVKGRYAYGFLKKETGVHRLVRISPFSAQKLRHTSFALVEVLPEIPMAKPSRIHDKIGIDNKEAELEIKPEDLRVDTFRASGPGGQYVNKTESAIRLTHVPTGLVVSSQSERLQGKNKENAMKILYAKLHQLKKEQRKKELKEIKGEQISVHPHTKRGGIRTVTGGAGQGKSTFNNKEGDTRSGVGASWGNQIRSYVLHPYKMVKDLRTQYETSDVEGVLDGDLEKFIETEIKFER